MNICPAKTHFMRKILLFVLPVVLLAASCRFGGGKKVHGNGNIQTEERQVSSFSQVEVHGAIKVYVSQGELKPAKLEGDENLLQYIEFKQEGNKLEVRTKRGSNLDASHDMKLYLSSPTYEVIDVSGACDIIGQTVNSNPSKLEMQVSGAGDIKMEVDAPEVFTDISGSGSVTLQGKSRDYHCGLSGAGNARCYDLLAENVWVDISGAGDADVYASINLEAEVSGAGTVRYKGDAKITKQQISGAGSIKKVN
jgi:hypothetical protein